MGLESRTWQVIGLLRDQGRRRDEHRELWFELCAELERIVQASRYRELCLSGDGVPVDGD